ncbi:hypothetical protein H0H92_001148 [Tricholoma furcatifolium]|nr:hypothetical protein H0H92_001148 [Tricholoma furcatifolium]
MDSSNDSTPHANKSLPPQPSSTSDTDNSNNSAPDVNELSPQLPGPTTDMNNSNGPIPRITFVYYIFHHPYRRTTPTARPNEPQVTPVPIASDSLRLPIPQLYTYPSPTTNYRRAPLYTPPQPYDPVVGIHLPLSPREIHRRQQILTGRRLVALFSIPQFRDAVRNGWNAARAEERRNMPSTSKAVEDSDLGSNNGPE